MRRSPCSSRASRSRHARQAARCSPLSGRSCPSCGADPLTSLDRTTPRSPAPLRLCPRTTRRRHGPAISTAACCTSASASTRWASILNGIQLHGKTRSYGGTFLIFADYMRPAVRLAALMNVPEHLRLDARLDRARRGRPDAPADRAARDAPRDPEPHDGSPGRRQRGVDRVARDRCTRHGGPTGIALTRQNVPVLPRGGDFASHEQAAEGVRRGAYVLADTPTDSLDVLIIATGSEVQLAVEARASGSQPRASACASSRPRRSSGLPSRPTSTARACSRRQSPRASSVEAGLSSAGSAIVGDRGRPRLDRALRCLRRFKTLFREVRYHDRRRGRGSSRARSRTDPELTTKE